MSTLTRRRFMATSAAATLTPSFASASVARWSGHALGAATSMQLVDVDDTKAARVFEMVEAEMIRLESIFSLYQDTSELSRLNKAGYLATPSAELLEVLSACASLHDASKGQFDPTIQPVWRALARAQNAAQIAQAQARVGWSKLYYDANEIRLPKGGALTLNGIAQGAITDRITKLLRAQGLHNVMVDMGEIAALGQGPNGPWSIGVATPDGTLVHRLTARDRAVATSVPLAMKIKAQQGHILSPTGVKPVNSLACVSAPTAMIADGLSTALCFLNTADANKAVAHFQGARIEIMTAVL